MSEMFHVDAANVMHEMIEGEVVIVNLQLGTYYSLDTVGADVWALLTAGSTLDGVVSGVASRYSADRDQIVEGIERFVRQLRDENLILAMPEGGECPVALATAADPARAYSDPVLQKYTDMEQLLLVDPIHEVEDSGWPDVK